MGNKISQKIPTIFVNNNNIIKVKNNNYKSTEDYKELFKSNSIYN